MPPRPRAVIFDLDGTLADSVEGIACAMNAALGELGRPPHSVPAFSAMVGEGVQVLVARAWPDATAAQAEQLITRYREHYGRVMHTTTRLFPGIEALLEALAARQVPLGVLSNKRDDFTRDLVGSLLGRWSFFDVRGERDGVPRKPSPVAALDMAEVAGVKPAEVAFVGDTAVDVETALAAGMLPIGVAWGFRPEELGRAAKIIHKPLELLEIF